MKTKITSFVNSTRVLVAISVFFLASCSKSINQPEEQSNDVYFSEEYVQRQGAQVDKDVDLRLKEQAEQLGLNTLESKNNNQNIVQIAVSNPNFSALVAAVVKTGLAGALSNESANLTVFAPVNSAFAQLPAPFNNAANISSITDQAEISFLRNVLLYHVLASKVKSQQISRDPSSAVTLKPAGTRNDNTIYLSKFQNLVRVNGRTDVIAANINATNGIIHAIDKVLMSPSKTIAEIAIADPNFSALVAALVKTNLAGVFSGNGDFTVFAPTNAAFAKLPAPFNSAASINGITNTAQIDALANILKYHVVANQRNFNWDFDVLRRISTLAAGTNNKLTTVIGFNTGFVKGNNNPGFSQVNPGDILATNGVIHVIPNVLLP